MAQANIRVALVGCHGLLGDIIWRTVADQPDLEVVGDFDRDLPDELDADLVVWNDADEAAVKEWLAELRMRRVPRVIATVGDGRDAFLWELVPRREALGALSPTTLVETIHQSFARDQP